MEIDARYGPKTGKCAHLFYHWQQRPENPDDKYGHFSFLTPVPEGAEGDLVLPATVPICNWEDMRGVFVSDI